MSEDRGHKALSEAIKNYVVALGILIGGGWTVYEFAMLERAERSQLERALAETKLARERLQLLQYRLNLTLETDVIANEAGGFLILGEVKMENVSDIRVEVPLEPSRSTLQALRLEPQPGEDPLSANRQIWRPRDHLGPITGVTVLPSRTITLPFTFWVETPGIYLLSFQSEIVTENSPEDSALIAKFNADKFLLGETKLIQVGVEADRD